MATEFRIDIVIDPSKATAGATAAKAAVSALVPAQQEVAASGAQATQALNTMGGALAKVATEEAKASSSANTLITAQGGIATSATSATGGLNGLLHGMPAIQQGAARAAVTLSMMTNELGIQNAAVDGLGATLQAFAVGGPIVGAIVAVHRFGDVIGPINDQLREAREAQEAWTQALRDSRAEIDALIASHALEDMDASMGQVTQHVKDSRTELQKEAQAYGKDSDARIQAAGHHVQVLQELIRENAGNADAVARYQAELDSANAAEDRLYSGRDKRSHGSGSKPAAVLDPMAEWVKSLVDPMDELIAKEKALAGAHADGTIAEKVYGIALGELLGKIGALKDAEDAAARATALRANVSIGALPGNDHSGIMATHGQFIHPDGQADDFVGQRNSKEGKEQTPTATHAMTAVLTLNQQVKAGLSQTVAQATDVAGAINGAFVDAFAGIEDALVNFVKTGELNFGQLADTIIGDLAKIAIRALEVQALTAIFKGSAPGSFGASIMEGLTGHATGADFIVGGNGGTDTTPVAFRATPGERVIVQTPAQQQAAAQSSSGGGGAIHVHNHIDSQMMGDYLDSPAGERVIKNIIRRNAGALKSTG